MVRGLTRIDLRQQLELALIETAGKNVLRSPGSDLAPPPAAL
jgi:hypothetical protein